MKLRMLWSSAIDAVTQQVTILSILILLLPLTSAVSAVFTVVNTDDQGTGSLRWAVEQANTIVGLDSISFAIPGTPPFTIQPQSPLPVIYDPLVVDGTTQPGYVGTPVIEIDGTYAGANDIPGIAVTGGASTIRGLVINRFSSHGIRITGGTGNLICGNYVGIDVSGSIPLGNGAGGIHIDGSSGNNTIGGLTTGDRNVSSANGKAGIGVAGHGNTILGNYIGTDASGTLPLGNSENGVSFGSFASNNTVGGTVPEARNVICDNLFAGIAFNTNSHDNVVLGNYIGVDASGTAGLGNVMPGIWMGHNVHHNTIGGTEPGSRNVISSNDWSGVHFEDYATANHVLGNYIGVDASGDKVLPNAMDGIHIMHSVSDNYIGNEFGTGGNLISGNTRDGIRVLLGVANSILSNSIHSNGALGIDLQGNGVTPNDWRDLDTGANTLQNYPELLSAHTSDWGSSIRGKLNSTPSAAFRIEFFSNSVVDPSGYGEGETFICAITETADGTGNAFFTVILPYQLTLGSYITSTATSALNNTSEFSEAIPVEEMTLAVQLQLEGILLEWSPVPEIAAFWVFGATNNAFFEAGEAPDYENRLAIVAPDETSWFTDIGVGDPTENWTYLVMAIDATDQELCRTSRAGEFDFAEGIP